MAVEPVSPGWYPSKHGMLRYWDGTAWTAHYAPAPMGPDPRAVGVERTALSVLGIIAVALFVCSVVVALVWGMAGLDRIGDSEPIITITQSVR